ncbi:MAG: amidase family protein [Acidimicrobiales bacterium]
MTPEEYRRLDATAIAELVRGGELATAEIAAAARARHEATHHAINAVVEWFADPTPSTGTGPFAGVPFLSKDYGSAEKGRLVEMGSRLAAGHRATVTDPFVARLQRAGAMTLGRSAVPELILHGTTESIVHGITRNPHGLEWSAGGSSGGAAAAVAAGVVPIATRATAPGRSASPLRHAGWSG